MNTLRRRLLFISALVVLGLSGCNPFAMGIATPIPVPPWLPDQIEARMLNPADSNTVILQPIPAGYRPLCEDPPDKATILRAMPAVVRGIPYIYEEFRDDVDVSVERLVDEIDPPRFFPLIGPAQLHHCHYKCMVYYTETIQSDVPIPFQTKKRRVEVVYIDRDHLHMYACTPEQKASMAQDFKTIMP
ncbi:MAG TPA: hypothetical protein VE988_21655 [Gemmataceae bacterium]|nr:hypothetical protein [Gemmataceae bacterium]